MSSTPNARLPGQDFLRTLRARALQALGADEADPQADVQATLETDLDDQLRFAPGLALLTSRHIATAGPVSEAGQCWAIAPQLQMRERDHNGVGVLELHDGQQRLAAWRFTLGQHASAMAFKDRFEQLREQVGEPARQPVLEADADTSEPAPDEADTPEDDKPPSSMTLFRLWRFAKPYKWPLALGFSLMLASTAANMVPLYMTKPLMDEVLIPFQNGVHIEPALVAKYLAGLFGAAILAWVLGWAKTYILAIVSERIGADLRTTTYDHLLRLSLEYFGRRRTGDLMARIGSETDRINVFLSLHLLDFLSDVVMIIMTGVILFSINPTLALITLVPLPLIAWMIHAVRDRLRTGFEKMDRVWAEVTNVLADTIPGIRVVKAFAQEARESERFHEANRINVDANNRLNKVWSLFTPTVTLLTELGLLVVWAAGIYLIARGKITVGTLTMFLAYIGRFYTRLDSMSRIVSVTSKAATGTKRIFEILDHVSSVPEAANPIRLSNVRGQIDIEDAYFRYGNRSVLRGLNLQIKPGEMIGLVGHSGSGKSTLVNLICRFYDVSDGAIRIDGHDIRDVKVSDYRRNIGLVLQEPFLFFGTIAENIAYGKPEATREEIVAAARAAHAHEFILRLPQGYDSIVGERGQGLSGGERQRISIARALLIDPRILILDEATSSVDTETEKEIQKALDNLVRGRTTIAIAHRLSTLQKADRLVVMDKGVKVEEGTHADLLAKEGFYYRLYDAQQRQEEADRVMLGGGAQPADQSTDAARSDPAKSHAV